MQKSWENADGDLLGDACDDCNDMSGDINDMKETKSEIVELSEFPVSIIIVGVGNSDFSKMIDLHHKLTDYL